MDESVKRSDPALLAASHVARRLGVDGRHAYVIDDSNNTIVHLAPAPVVAKVGTSTLRPDMRKTLESELQIALHLAARGAPIAPPTAHIPPGPHLQDNLAVTLWHYVETTAGRPLQDKALGDMLSSFHRIFADYPQRLPDFTEALDRARTALHERERTPALPDDDRSFLVEVASTIEDALRTRDLPRHPLHGDPHLDGNILTTADGPLLVDFEAACSGPHEWDLTSLPRAISSYDVVDRELLSLLSRMRSLVVSTWCWMQYGRAPEVEEAAHVHLRLLRDAAAVPHGAADT